MDTLYLYHELEHLLRQESTYCMADGQLIKNKIVEDAFKLEPHLLHLLVSHKDLKDKFFQEVDGMWVFDKVEFERFVMNKSFLADSYTSFKNKVGLSVEDGRFISESREVVLSWPYKDCVLEGGQTKEDAKRDEIFWNETLAPEEINRLKEPKAFANFKRFDKDGEHSVDSISDSDNLIIKGNNLLALYSLKKKYAGKVKLIYIDPPYYFNKVKAGDSFCYNSNFRLSTWLVFMKDRLKMARELLSENGAIICHIKEDAVHWLKVLMEEIFGSDNFVDTFIWKNTDNPDSLSKKSRASVEYMICYEKKMKASLSYIGKDTENGDAPLLNSGNSMHELVFPAGSILFNIPDGIYPKGKPDRVEILSDIQVENGRNVNEVHLLGEFKWGQDMLNEELTKGTYFLVKSGKFSIRFQRKEAVSMAPEKYFDEQYLSKGIGIGTNEDASSHLKKMGIKFSYSKPESVVAYFIRAITNEGDLILDFFVGSGTTAAVAMKMKRQFIAVDQMDYIESQTLVRLQKVIEGEMGGISKSVNWQGGGSFVYCELAKANEQFMEEIEVAKNTAELKEIWTKMEKSGYLCYRLNVASFEKEATTFEQLSLENQKRFLMECLDKNLLYVPLSDVDSNEYHLSDEDRRLTKEFYRK